MRARNNIDECVLGEMDADVYGIAELALEFTPVKIADVGANIGAFCMAAQELWPDAVIDAYEPEPENIQLLRGNVSGVRVHECAVWSSVGHTTYEANAGNTVTGVGDKKVSTIMLDTVIGDGLDLLKIDAEGAEHEFIPPATRLDRVQFLCMEYHDYSYPGGVVADVIGKLAETHDLTFGFRRFDDGLSLVHGVGGIVTGGLR